jgi:hypothetical protein
VQASLHWPLGLSSPHHASERLPAHFAGIVHSGQAHVGAVGNARRRGLRPNGGRTYDILAAATLEAASMPPAPLNTSSWLQEQDWRGHWHDRCASSERAQSTITGETYICTPRHLWADCYASQLFCKHWVVRHGKGIDAILETSLLPSPSEVDGTLHEHPLAACLTSIWRRACTHNMFMN